MKQSQLTACEACLTLCGAHHESDGSLLVDIDGDVGALDPGVGAQMSQSYVRVSGRQTAPFQFHSASLQYTAAASFCVLLTY